MKNLFRNFIIRKGNLRPQSWCKSCHKQQTSACKIKKRNADPETYRRIHRQKSRDWQYRQYGTTSKRIEELGKLQKWRCSICKIDISNKPYVDHNHNTGKVRGLLCMRCNLALGHFEDSIIRLIKAGFYLIKDSIIRSYVYRHDN